MKKLGDVPNLNSKRHSGSSIETGRGYNPRQQGTAETGQGSKPRQRGMLGRFYADYFRGVWMSVLRLSVNVWHQFIAHKCLQQASSLAFNTLLCFVPLSAVALFLLKTFGVVEDGNSPLIVALRDNFLPRYGAEEIVSELSAFANRNLGGLGVYGFLLFLLVSTMLFMSVEQHFNDIWRARRRLPIVQAFQKYAVFYTLLSCGTATDMAFLFKRY